MGVLIDKELMQDIRDYCEINNLKSTKYINSLLKKAFMVEKYGDKPMFLNKQQKRQKRVAEYVLPILDIHKQEAQTENLEEQNIEKTESAVKESPRQVSRKRKLN